MLQYPLHISAGWICVQIYLKIHIPSQELYSNILRQKGHEKLKKKIASVSPPPLFKIGVLRKENGHLKWKGHTVWPYLFCFLSEFPHTPQMSQDWLQRQWRQGSIDKGDDWAALDIHLTPENCMFKIGESADFYLTPVSAPSLPQRARESLIFHSLGLSEWLAVCYQAL